MDITSKDSFSLDNVECSFVGLYCDTPPIQMLAEEVGNNYNIGSDTEMYVSDDLFKDITFRFNCYSFKRSNFSMHYVYEYLRNKKELRISRDDGWYWKVRSITCTPTASYDGKKIKYQINIKCDPWKYMDEDTPVNVTQSVTNVVCGGTRYCKPLYKLTLSAYTGTGMFSVNTQQVSIIIPTSMDSNILYIDSEKQIAYDGSQNPQMRTTLTNGIYPFMNVGNNIVTFGGIVESIEIKRNQRCY